MSSAEGQDHSLAPDLVGPRVRLRQPVAKDVQEIVASGRDPEITRAYGADPADLPPLDAAAAQAMVCGFTHEGRERESALVAGAWCDDLMMGILATDARG